MPMLTGLMSCGVYDIPKVDFHFDAVVTNTTPIGAYRGAGPPGGDGAGRARDRHVRRRARDGPGRGAAPQLHHRVPAPDGHGRQLRLGRVPRGAGQVPGQRRLRGAARRAGGAARARRRQAARARALLLRRVDRASAPSSAPARSRRTARSPSPRARPRTARATRRRTRSSSSGTLGVPLARRARSSSPTPLRSRAAWARWARARCRSAAPRSSNATDEVLEKARRLAAHLLEADAGDIEVVPGEGLGVAGSPASAIPWAQLAQAAADPSRAPEGFEGGLSRENDFETPDATYPFGTHLAVVEVDTETGPRAPDPPHHRRRRGPDRATRCWSRARSTAASPRASRRRCSRRSPSTRTATTSPARWPRYAIPTRRRPADLRDRAHADADAAQPAGRQGHRRVGRDRRDAGRLERRRRRPVAPRRARTSTCRRRRSGSGRRSARATQRRSHRPRVVVPSPMLARTAPGSSGSRPRRSSACSRCGLGVGDVRAGG